MRADHLFERFGQGRKEEMLRGGRGVCICVFNFSFSCQFLVLFFLRVRRV